MAKRTKLNQSQLTAIALAVQGKKWSDIAREINVQDTTLWVWRQNELFVAELAKAQEKVFAEIARHFDTYVNAGYKVLYQIATDETADLKYRTDCATKLIELSMNCEQTLKLLEHNRRELKLEDASIREETGNSN
jgi:hypothetical protein